jgi:hypothetical protein
MICSFLGKEWADEKTETKLAACASIERTTGLPSGLIRLLKGLLSLGSAALELDRQALLALVLLAEGSLAEAFQREPFTLQRIRIKILLLPTMMKRVGPTTYQSYYRFRR